MRIAVRVLLLLVALGVVVMGLETIAAESGEVVVLRTRDGVGGLHETRVWVVDEGGHTWLRAGQPKSSWLLRIQQNPAVEVERNGRSAPYTAVPDVASRERLNPLFRAKYGWADAYIGTLFGHGRATPIRLDPRS